MDKKLEVKNLQVSFRTQGGIVKAVRDISFDLYKGETLAIVGESGSGKSVTSKAIIGILAGNSIVEGGEIVYNGQDLLKIEEEDFHKIRGDKIAMIFQDPMSSLNPIMRVGQQLTEAMILKSKTSRKNAKVSFNTKLALLSQKIILAKGADDKQYQEEINDKCKRFDEFCLYSLQLEHEYNEAYSAVIGVQVDVESLLFLLEKKQKVDINKKIKEIVKQLKMSTHPYVMPSEASMGLIDAYSALASNGISRVLSDAKKALSTEEALLEEEQQLINSFVGLLNRTKEVVDKAVENKKPNFFTLGYYKMHNPQVDVYSMDIDELDVMTRQYLDNNFMLDFIKVGQTGVSYAQAESLQNKKATLTLIENAIHYFNNVEMDKKVATDIALSLGAEVKKSINYLTVKKNSTEYTFPTAIKSAVETYFKGVKSNPINQAKYDKTAAKYSRLVESGKTPTWKLIPPRLLDLELARKNIVKILENLKASYEYDFSIASEFDSQAAMVELVDFFKEQASLAVHKVTHKMAKARALKLLEEVGIPDPELRFYQYPFEFSGGMRQRIVIAIALSANPDILICDEPTTALDVTIQAQILELINKIKVERNLSVIFITHDLGVVANMADRIAVMYAGKIVEYGTSEDLFYDPRHPYTWALLSSMPDLDTTDVLESIPGTPPNMIYPPKGDAFAERNKFALEIDFELQPPLFEVSETHYAATWLLHPNAPKVDPPKIVTDRIERMKGAHTNE